MKKIFIGYATIEGQTEKIAKEIEKELIASGVQVDLYSVENLPPRFDYDKYNGVILGASVHLSNFPKELRQWVRANAIALSKVHSAFFSVCLGILDTKNPGTKEAEFKILANFFEDTGWTPSHWTVFAGALKYSKYGWLKKLMLKSIAGSSGGDTDTSRDYEYTDWNAVKMFALNTMGPSPQQSIG